MAEVTAAAGKGDVPAIIQREAIAMRSRQDRKLQELLRIATGSLVVFLTIGTIAVAAADAIAPSTATVVLAFAGMIAVGLVVIQVMIASRWREGPKIEVLLEANERIRPSDDELRLALTRTMRVDHEGNQRTLRSVRAGVAVVLALAFLGLLTLLVGLQELV